MAETNYGCNGCGLDIDDDILDIGIGSERRPLYFHLREGKPCVKTYISNTGEEISTTRISRGDLDPMNRSELVDMLIALSIPSF